MTEVENLRVAMIIQSYLPRLGGAEKQLAAICRELRNRGVEPLVITRRYAGMPAYELIEQTPVYRTPAPRPKALAAFCYILFGLLRIGKLHVDVLHVHELLSPSDMAVLAKKIWHKPLVVKVLRGGKLGDLDKLHRRRFGSVRIRRLVKHVDMFISISEEISAELAREGIEKQRCRFIPNGVDLQVYKPLPVKAREELRKELNLPKGKLCIYSGRLAPEKGLVNLMQAWREIVKSNPEAHLLILGSGEMENELRAAAGENVIFAGYVPEAGPYYQVSDVFILPSETEGLSNAMLEAMACGLAVVATTVGAAQDVIEHNVSGMLVKPGAVNEIVSAVDHLFKHPQVCTRLGKQGMQKVRREYSLENTVDRLVELYTELDGGGNTR